MEGTEAAWVTGSGLAAITSALIHEVKTGDHIISSMTTYGGTFAFLAKRVQPTTRICVACDLTLPTQYIRTRMARLWLNDPPQLHKRPTIFLLYK